MSLLALQLLQAFNLEEISHQAFLIQNEEKERKRLAAERLTLSYVMSPQGFALAELFGFYLSKQLKEDLIEIGRRKERIRLSYDQFVAMMNELWVNMKQYKLFLPILFTVLKDYNSVSLRDLHNYLEICKAQINPFMARLKQLIPPLSKPQVIIEIKELTSNIESACEREDLKNQGFVDKLIIVDLIKKYLTDPKESIQIDERLIVNDEVNYRLLLSSSYLKAGEGIRQFLEGKLANKIKRLVKRAALKKKGAKKKKEAKRIDRTSAKKKQTKQEKIIRQFMQENKKEVKEDRKKLELIIKSLVYECIQQAAEISAIQTQQKPETKLKKSIYTGEPVIVERELKLLPGQTVKAFPISHDSAMFISQGQGRIISLLDGSIKSSFNLNPSHLLKKSSVCDYHYINNVLYVLREDGLLFSWNSEMYSYNKLVQTQYRYIHKPIEQFNSKKAMFINQGIVIINCEETNNSLELYSLDLQFVGNIFIKKEQYGLSHAIVKESRQLSLILKNIKRDYLIKSQFEYQGLIRANYQYKEYQLGNYLYSRAESVSALKVGDHTDWISSYKTNNPLYFDKSMMQRLKIKKTSKADYAYLLNYHYIKEATAAEVENFIRSHCIIQVEKQRRKSFLITLFQDNALKELGEREYMSRQQLLGWIEKCSLSQQEQNQLFYNLTYNSQGKVCLHEFIHSEQYLKIFSLRHNRFYANEYYETNQLPPIIFNEILPFPLLQSFIATTKFPNFNYLYIFSFRNVLIHKINLNDYLQGAVARDSPVLTYCQESGYLAVCYNNVITVWNINKITEKDSLPIKKIKGLEKDVIIDMQFMYFSNTFATFTKNYIKFWDLDQILFKNEANSIVFKIKPGFKAVERQSEVSKWQAKKKIMIRGKSQSFFNAATKASNYIVGVVSGGQRTTEAYLKLFYICKFHIMIGSSRQYDQVPTKILRQLDSEARRMKYIERVLDPVSYNDEQKRMVGSMIAQLRERLGVVRESNSKELSIALINKVSNLHAMLTTYSRIVCPSLLKAELQIDQVKVFKFNLMLKIYLCESSEELSSVFAPEFVQLYKEKGQLSKEAIMQDIFQWQDRTYLSKFLCLMSQICKYSLPYKCSYIELIYNQKQDKLDANLVQTLLANSQISKSIIQLVVSLTNQLKIDSVKAITTKVIDKFLPTQYRYPSLRYYKSIYSHTVDTPFSYFINRYDNYSHINPKEVIISPKGYKDIFDHIEKENILEHVQELSKLYPQIVKDNLQLIDLCMSYSLITEHQATFYFLAPTNTSLLNLLSDNQPKRSIVDFDNVISLIVYALSQQKVKIPTPHFTYQWFSDRFKSVIGNDDKVYDIFYNELRGSITQHIAYSRQLQFYIQLNKKNIRINYNPINWKYLIGTRIYPLTYHLQTIKERFYKQKVVDAYSFQKYLAELVPKEAQTITVRACAASKNHESYIKNFKEERNLKQYQEDYINVEHFLLFLDESKRQREAQTVATHQLQTVQLFDLKIPTYCLISQLSKCSAFLTRQQLIQLASESVSSFTYGSMLDWIKALPFARMRGKEGKESRVCAIWELKRYLKPEWEMLGWMLLNKYGKVNVLNKCIIVQGTIDVKQLSQVFFSQAIFKLFVSCFPQLKEQDTYPLQILERIVDKELVNPALQCIYQAFRHQIGKYLPLISEVLNALASKTEEIDMQKFIKYFLTNSDTKQAIIKLIFNNIIGRTKRIKIKQSLNKIISFAKNTQQTKGLADWLEAHENDDKSLLEKIIPIIEPHRIINKKEVNPENLLITREHFQQITRQESWTHSYQPFFTLPQFFDFIYETASPSEHLSSLINNCILKHGIHSIFNSIEQGQFAQFYAKCRSVSKSLAKLTVVQFCKLYQLLSQEGKGLSLLMLFKASQLEIMPEERISWIIEYSSQVDKQSLNIQTHRVSNLILNTQEPASELQQLVGSLKYEEYLVKRYIKSANKLAMILKQLEDTVTLYKTLSQLHLSHEQISLLSKYLKTQGEEMLSRLRQSQNKATAQLSQSEEKILLEQIANYIAYFEQESRLTKDNPEFNMNFTINDVMITETFLFKKMNEQNSPQWSCLPTYINLYHYCQHFLVNSLFRKYGYRQMILDELNKCMLATSLSLKNLYDLFGLAYYDNFMKYLTFFISPNPKHHAISSKVFKTLRKYIFQAFIRYDGVNEIKYPLNFGSFKQLMGQVDVKSEQRSINYGEMYKKYNIWGCGYINLNDIPSQRSKRLSHPYIEINSYLSEAFPSIKGWKKINPPIEVFENREKICNELIKLEEQSQMKSKLIGESNLWRILGFYLTKQHRLYIQHEFQAKGARQFYNIVDIVEWINSQDDSEALTADLLAKTVAKLEDEGGIYSVLRKYHKQVILAQESDSYKQQNAYLLHLLQQSGALQANSLKEYVRQLLANHSIEQYVDKQHQMENSGWLEQSLRLIVDTYNREVREWTNYNNNLVKFLNELPQNPFSLIRQLYQSNYQYSCHKLFDILANGSLYFTFTTFWVYNTSSDDAYPYSKEEVHEVYKIIDVNSDGNISYQQFCRFWSAVEQIYVHPTPPIINKITIIKLSILQAFLDSIKGSFEKEVSSESGFITIQMLQMLTNIKHKQKLQRLIKIISPQDKFGQCIDLHKLKVLLKQHNAKKNKERLATIKHSNYFSKTLGADIQEYINNKDNLQNTLSRWLVFTYPNFGHYLAQCFFQFCWDKSIITQWISNHQSKIQSQGRTMESLKKIDKGINISPQNEGLFQRLITLPKKFELFYKKFLRKHYEPKYYGKSISYKMCLNKILDEYATTIQGMNHISYFLQDFDFSQNRLIYKFEESQKEHYDPEDTGSSFASFKAAVIKGELPFSKYSQRIIIKQNLSCIQSAFEYFYKREYEIINKQLRCKSNNRLSLLANKTLYSDYKISISFYDEEHSNSNKFILYSDFSRFRPLPELQIKKNSKFASLQSMIKLADLAAYIQKNYQIIGLFVNMHNICIDFNEARQFRLAQFIGGIKLDSQGNYFEGINPKDINSDDHCIYPPQIFENIFTQTFDSYCLAHILYYFFTGEFVANKEIVPSAEESVWFNYSQLHYSAQKQISFLSLLDKNIDIESQIVFFTLLYDCTSFQWHLRPQLHQIASTLRNIGHLHCNLEDIGNEQLIVKAKISQICQHHLQANNVEMFASSVEASKEYEWTMQQIERIRLALPQDPRYYSIYNDLLQKLLERLEDCSQVGEMGEFMASAVEYFCQSTKKQTAFMALQAFKNIITSSTVKRYLDYCDEKWKINQFNIHEKLKQLNTQNRILKLPKSSQYYLDLSTLIDSKITLFMTETTETKNKKDSTKKIAISFIESSLSSHNVNKICALQKSGVMLNLYRYIQQPEFEQAILKIYCLATECLNSQESTVTHRAIEEGYKVMMVMHNIINLQRGSKSGETVVDMLTYMNNYYNFYGEECKTYVLKRLCNTQICNYATFSFLFNLKINSKDYLYKMLLNLTYQQKYWKMLKGVTVQAYDSYLKEIKKSPKHQQVKDKLEQLLRTHEARITLNELSTESIDLQSKQFYISKDSISSLYSSYQLLIEKHILFFNKKQASLTQGSHYRYQNNFYEHYQQFLKEIRRLVKAELDNTYFSAQSSIFIKNGLQLHYRLIELWSFQEETIKYIMELTEKMYQKESLYTQNKLLNEIEGTVFNIITALTTKSLSLLIKLGFIHFLMRVMKKQHQLLEHYVSKGVENIQLKNIYSQQAQFRLNTIDKLLQSNSEEIHRIFVGIGFVKYLVQTMLSSQLLLDLRYYKANFDIVPFRFCSPLRSQAITILSFILPIKESILRSEVVSRLISVIASEKEKLLVPVDSPQNKMKFVEALWLFGNIVECDDQRLKYEFVNNGGYNILSKLIEKYEHLNIFFPKMSETIKTGSILKSSMVFSRVLHN